MSAPLVHVPEVRAEGCTVDDGLALLRESGALVVRAAVDAGMVRRVDEELAPHFAVTPVSEGLFYGDATCRFGRVFARSRASHALATDRLVHGVAAAVLAPHRGHCLSFSQAIAVRSGAPAQVPHRDGEMWPIPLGGDEHLVSVMWPLTRFDAETGGTRVWPSGCDGGVPAQPRLDPGDALVFLGSTLHGAGANRSAAVRRGLVMGYAAAWLVPAESLGLSYPPDVARTFPRELAGLLGYRRLAPNLNNYDCRCPSELLEGDPGRGAVDELRPEQVQGLQRFYAAVAA